MFQCSHSHAECQCFIFLLSQYGTYHHLKPNHNTRTDQKLTGWEVGREVTGMRRNRRASSHSNQTELTEWVPIVYSPQADQRGKHYTQHTDSSIPLLPTTKQGIKYCLPTVQHMNHHIMTSLSAQSEILILPSLPPSCRWASLLYQKQPGSLEERQDYYLSHSRSPAAAASTSYSTRDMSLKQAAFGTLIIMHTVDFVIA